MLLQTKINYLGKPNEGKQKEILNNNVKNGAQ